MYRHKQMTAKEIINIEIDNTVDKGSYEELYYKGEVIGRRYKATDNYYHYNRLV